MKKVNPVIFIHKKELNLGTDLEELDQMMQDIAQQGYAGSLIFSWQDEWFKRTWNTVHAVDLDNTAYWSDAQTNEQFFGLLTFDPGAEKSVCYVDGDAGEWTEGDVVISDGEGSLSMSPFLSSQISLSSFLTRSFS